MATLSKTKTTYLRTRAFSDVCKGAGTEDEVKRTCSEAFAALGILDVSLKIVTKPVAKQFEVTAQVRCTGFPNHEEPPVCDAFFKLPDAVGDW